MLHFFQTIIDKISRNILTIKTLNLYIFYNLLQLNYILIHFENGKKYFNNQNAELYNLSQLSKQNCNYKS